MKFIILLIFVASILVLLFFLKRCSDTGKKTNNRPEVHDDKIEAKASDRVREKESHQEVVNQISQGTNSLQDSLKKLNANNISELTNSSENLVSEPKINSTKKLGNKEENFIAGFFQAISDLNPNEAKNYIDPSKVTYAKLAGLCIIFEEGKYKLLERKPIRKMFLRERAGGWLVSIKSSQKNGTREVALSTKRKDVDSPWKITEINLDKVLVDYAAQNTKLDVHYAPIVRNPQGGDSLVTYFDVDSDELTPRTITQLKIISSLLENNSEKIIHIGGHADSLGSDPYNLSLSQRRAQQVHDFLIHMGVDSSQIKTSAHGESKPRASNTTQNGKDFPEGRRANRRTEIYLDF